MRRGREVGEVGRQPASQPSLAYMGNSRSVRDPVSEKKMDGS